MKMKINCDKCGYILGGIEVKENYGCNACNPFYLSMPLMKDTSIIGGNTISQTYPVNTQSVKDMTIENSIHNPCTYGNDDCPKCNPQTNKKEEKSKSDGFETGVAEKTEECAWCGKVIHQYVSCYYGGQRVGNVIICKKCGDKSSALEDEAKYGK